VTRLGRLGPARPTHVGWARPSPQKKKKKKQRVGQIWPLGKTQPYALVIIFMPILI